MSDAPEKIWAGPSEDDKGVFWDVGHWDADHDENCIEYTRSDLPPSAEVIRGMVKPLVWEELDNNEYGNAFTAIGKNGRHYEAGIDASGQAYWGFHASVINDGSLISGWIAEAQAAANTHHANTILAALGLTK